ncbi:hypothetical protein D3C79_537510 [compost metagenome]
MADAPLLVRILERFIGRAFQHEVAFALELVVPKCIGLAFCWQGDRTGIGAHVRMPQLQAVFMPYRLHGIDET